MRFAATLLASLLFPAAHAAEYRAIGDVAAVLYDAPSVKADRLFVASRGYPFEVLVKLDQWTKVRDAGGEVAWVENKALGEQRTALVSVPIADVRAAPSAQSAIVFEAYRQVILEVLDSPADGWVKVRHRDGQEGYARVALDIQPCLALQRSRFCQAAFGGPHPLAGAKAGEDVDL